MYRGQQYQYYFTSPSSGAIQQEMLRTVLFVASLATASATILSPMPSLASTPGLGRMSLRGGAEDKPGMKRVLSHQDLDTEVSGRMDTADTRFYAKDVHESEHRSL